MDYSNHLFKDQQKNWNKQSDPNFLLDSDDNIEDGYGYNSMGRMKLMRSLQNQPGENNTMNSFDNHNNENYNGSSGFGNNIPMGGLGKKINRDGKNFSGVVKDYSKTNQIRKPIYPESAKYKPFIEKTPTHIFENGQNDFNDSIEKQLQSNTGLSISNNNNYYNSQDDSLMGFPYGNAFSQDQNEYFDESEPDSSFQMTQYELEQLNKRLNFERMQKQNNMNNFQQARNPVNNGVKNQFSDNYNNGSMNYPQGNGNSQNSIQGHGNLQGFNQGNSNPQYNPRENMQNFGQGNMQYNARDGMQNFMQGNPNLQDNSQNFPYDEPQNQSKSYFNQPLSKSIQPNLGYLGGYSQVNAKLADSTDSFRSQEMQRPASYTGNASNNFQSPITTLGSSQIKLQQPKDKDALGVANIVIVGCGGGGNNTIDRLKKISIKGASCISVNTDRQHLESVKSDHYILIGKSLTRGLGAGGQPEIGQAAAEESRDEINAALKGADLVFITCGMGGGTGTGSAPVVAEIAKKNDAIVVGVVTIPFKAERGRIEKATVGIRNLRQFADTLIIIDNNKLLDIASDLPINDAFSLADEVLATMVKGITEVISVRSMINLDFNDVRTTLKSGGVAIVGIGESREGDPDRIQSAIQDALNSPLLEFDIKGAKSALIHVSGGKDLTMQDAHKVAEILTKEMAPNATVIWGARTDPDLTGIIRVMLIITGVKSSQIMGTTNRYLN